MLSRSEESEYLQANHPNAFLLLIQISRRARRTAGLPDGYEIGEAHVGDYQNAGIETRDKYRTALEVLIKRKHIEKVETCRQTKSLPSSTPTTNNTYGTKVKLLSLTVCDINKKFENNNDPHLLPHQTPTRPPRTIKNKKEKEIEKINKKEKTQIREFVTLTSEELKKLIDTHGFEEAESWIEALNNYKGSKNVEYKSDYYTICQWHSKKVREDKLKAENHKGKTDVYL
jgi:hypothetical protein